MMTRKRAGSDTKAIPAIRSRTISTGSGWGTPTLASFASSKKMACSSCAMMNYKRGNFDMKNLPQLAPPLLALLLLCAVPGHSSNQNEGRDQTLDKIASTIRSQFGSKLKVMIAALANGSVIRPKRFSEGSERLH